MLNLFETSSAYQRVVRLGSSGTDFQFALTTNSEYLYELYGVQERWVENDVLFDHIFRNKSTQHMASVLIMKDD